MNQNLQNFHSLKEIINKFKGELKRTAASNALSSTDLLKMCSNIDEIEKNMGAQEKLLVNSVLSRQRTLTSSPQSYYGSGALPTLMQPKPAAVNFVPEDDIYTSLKYVKQSKLEQKYPLKRREKINEERLNFIKNMQKRKNIGRFKQANDRRVAAFNSEREKEQLLEKYNIKNDYFDHIKVTNKRPNFMDPMKRIKYNILSRTATANVVTYDKHNQPIIKKEELDKGLYNMINKGLIPKGADLSPAFENNGHNPMQINVKNEVQNAQSTFNHTAKPADRKDADDYGGFFITKQNPNMELLNNVESLEADDAVRYREKALSFLKNN